MVLDAAIEAGVVTETNDDTSDTFMMIVLCLRVCKYKEKQMFGRKRNEVRTHITLE